MSGAVIAALQRCLPCTLAGSLDGTNTTATVTGTARAVTVPAPNPGVLKFQSLVEGSGTCKYSKNGGAFTQVTEGLEVTFANGDTLQMQGVSMTASTSITVKVFDKNTNTQIGAQVVITRN